MSAPMGSGSHGSGVVCGDPDCQQDQCAAARRSLATCQRCGKTGGKVVHFKLDGGTMSMWACPYCIRTAPINTLNGRPLASPDASVLTDDEAQAEGKPPPDASASELNPTLQKALSEIAGLRTECDRLARISG